MLFLVRGRALPLTCGLSDNTGNGRINGKIDGSREVASARQARPVRRGGGHCESSEPGEATDQMSMRRHRVCSVQELPPGKMRLVPVGKFGVGVYNIDGEFYAIANYCSHEGAPLCTGYVGGTNVYDPNSPGRVAFVKGGRIVRCPWHQWEFDISTGQTLADPGRRIRTYHVDVTAGEVFVTA